MPLEMCGMCGRRTRDMARHSTPGGKCAENMGERKAKATRATLEADGWVPVGKYHRVVRMSRAPQGEFLTAWGVDGTLGKQRWAPMWVRVVAEAGGVRFRERERLLDYVADHEDDGLALVAALRLGASDEQMRDQVAALLDKTGPDAQDNDKRERCAGMDMTKFCGKVRVRDRDGVAEFDNGRLTIAIENIDSLKAGGLVAYLEQFEKTGVVAKPPSNGAAKVPAAPKAAVALAVQPDDIDDAESAVDFFSRKADEATAGKPAPPLKAKEPFVEDLDVDQAVDRGERVKQGKEEAPPKLVGAKSLKDVLLFFADEHKLTRDTDLVAACEKWRDVVPCLSRIDPKALRLRVKTATETLGIGR